MMKYKKPLLFALCLLPAAVAAGIFTGWYQIDVSSVEVIAMAIEQLGSIEALVAVGVVQTVGYALFCGFFGYILADKVGLWKPLKWEKRPLIITLAISFLGGILFSLDYWTFGSIIEGIRSADRAGMTGSGVAASILYGGVIEEVMIRLFFMSLIAFIIWKVFFRKYDKEQIPDKVFFLANVVAAIAFAAGHLPATYSMFPEVTSLIIFRCFLLNGGFGLIFGRLYRQYGIAYAMISHSFIHIVSKLIWFVFMF